MPRNVEIKARVTDLDEVKKVAASLSGSEATVIPQRDVFFNVSSGSISSGK
jgi:adenylate cyclase class IV